MIAIEFGSHSVGEREFLLYLNFFSSFLPLDLKCTWEISVSFCERISTDIVLSWKEGLPPAQGTCACCSFRIMGDKEISEEDAKVAALVSTVTDEKVKPRKGMVSRIWSAMGLVGHLFFRNSKEDFEKRLQHLSKEEVAVHTRLKRRTAHWRKFARNLILYSVIGEVLVLGFAIWATRAPYMEWESRALRVLPVFALPLFTTLLYTSCSSFYRMREAKDQKTLEKLRAERQSKIDELKEKTNYYLTQQLIQKYDLDPAAKAAAASVLASKLGAESGLKIALEAADLLEKDQTGNNTGRSQGMEVADASGVRKRRTAASQADPRKNFVQSNHQVQGRQSDRMDMVLRDNMSKDLDAWEHEREVEHHRAKPNEGGWIARLAAMLVGEDPSQCYALICGNCHMHNGLAKKEDFQYITYYCPHCHALNKSNNVETGAQGVKSLEGLDSPTSQTGSVEEVFSSSGPSSLVPALAEPIGSSAASHLAQSIVNEDLNEGVVST
ncbi:hypothetical protein R1flu_011794 [Riccia fluitans]|uniref:Lunapark zinc ribbon domain-containing protein n=1 Tax=Riccia fluitans TaxID=41844 RepID=A0ABD1ZCZ4_9MARC